MPRIRNILPISALALALTASASFAGDVFRTVDASGNPIYTDRPATLPAERLKVKSASTDTVGVQQRYDEEMKRMNAGNTAASDSAKAAQDGRKTEQLTAEDKAKRCTEARARHEQYEISRKMYETNTENGERRYLSDEEMTAARERAKKVMDEFCGG